MPIGARAFAVSASRAPVRSQLRARARRERADGVARRRFISHKGDTLKPCESVLPRARARASDLAPRDGVNLQTIILSKLPSARADVATMTSGDATKIFFTALAALALVAARAAARALTTREAKKRVVIIGGGFAGMQAALDLRKTCEVTLIDKKRYFEYVPGTPAALAGAAPLSPASRGDSAKKREKTLTVPYSKALGKSVAFECAAGRDVRVMSAYVDVGGDCFEYDELILATGSHYPGVLKAECDGEAGEDRDARMREIAEAREDVTKGKSVVVIGGGVVGVELAGELAARNAKMKSGARVILVHSGPRLLDTLPKFVSEYVSKTLVRFGVEAYVGQTYDRVGDSFVGRMNENVIEGDRVMMCVGAKPATEFLDRESVNFSEDDDDSPLNFPLDMIGRVRVDEATRQVIGYDNVYAVGDCACKLPDQMLASYAHWEAEYVSKRIMCDGDARALGKLGRYRLPPRLMAISLGPFAGVVVWGDRILCRGWCAAVFKALIQFWFIRFLPAPYSIMKRFPRMRVKPPASVILRKPLAN